MTKFKSNILETTSIALLSLLVFASPLVASAAVDSRKHGAFPIGMDTWYGSVFNTSAQHDEKLKLGGWGDEYDALTRFDLSGLPLDATQAILWLYHYGTENPTNINWYRNTEQWHSGSVGWSNRPASSYVGTTGAPSGTGWYGIDITSFYDSWRAGNPSNENFGFSLKPAGTNNQFEIFASSGNSNSAIWPQIDVYYTTSPTDNIPKLKWLISTPSYANRTVNHSFGANWAANVYCGGLIKKHNGTDFTASAGTAVYAGEDGIVKEIINDSPWAYNIVMEHTSPTGGKYTTVYWHVNPSADAFASNSGGFIPKGSQIATVADLGSNTHIHIGTGMTAYSSPDSGSGASPQTNCGGYLAFPASFVDPNDTSNIIYH